MIGDSPTSDIMGAQAAGMKSIYFDRNRQSIKEPLPTNYVVHTLNEIFSIL